MKSRGLWSYHTINQRANHMSYVINQRLGLPAPFPSSPSRTPSHSITVRVNRDEAFYSWNFCEIYPMKHMIERMFADREYKWVDERTIQTIDDRDPHIIVKGDIEQVFDHEFTGKEAQWVIPDPYASNIARMRRETPAVTSPEPALERPKQKSRGADAKPGKKPRRDKNRPAPRASREGRTTIGDIAARLGIPGAKARQALRKSDETMPTPELGWSWTDQSDIDRIEALLKKSVK